MTKVSSFNPITGAAVDQATDLLEIIDMSEAGAARNKKITIAEFLSMVDAGAVSLDDLSDVDLSTANDGDVLTFDLSQGLWVPMPPDVGGGGGPFALGDATDCNTTGAAVGDVLTYDGAEFVPSPPYEGGGGSSGALQFIGRVPVSALSAVDIALPDGYDSFHIEFYFTASADQIGLNAAVTDDNFATVESGATDYYYSRLAHTASSTGVVSSNGTTVISVLGTSSIGNAANEYCEGSIEVINAKETAPTGLRIDISWITGTTTFGSTRAMASYKQTNLINGLRITPTSGNLTGFYKVWGRTA